MPDRNRRMSPLCCGELGADVTLTETFLRMGIDELSVPPSMILKIREAVRSMDLTGPDTVRSR